MPLSLNNPRLLVFANFVRELTSLSKCTDKHVAAIICDEEATQVFSIGINGGPKGGIDCLCTLGGKYTCVHAEIAAIGKCPVSCDGKMMICSFSPCVTCATEIINCGIRSVMFLESYKDDTGLRLLNEAGVQVAHLDLKSNGKEHE